MPFVALLLVLRDLDGSVAQSQTAASQAAVTHAWARSAQILSHLQERSPIQKICARVAHVQLSLLCNEHKRPSLRVTVLCETGDLCIPLLLDALATEPYLAIGTHRYHVLEARLSHSPWAGLSSWADLLAPPYAHTVTLHLGTPLVLLKDERRDLFPLPCQIFATLAQRWQELGGPPLPISSQDLSPRLLDGSIVLADYRLHSCQVLLDESIQLGFRGWISYQSRCSCEALSVTLTALSRFAFFAGVGAATERGMGTTRVTIR
jgi:hypothetical protein